MSSLIHTVRSWIGLGGNYSDEDVSSEYNVDYVRVIPFFGMHAAALTVFFVGWSWIAVLTAAALYAVRMFAITAFYHRYFSHRTFKTNRFFQFLFGVLGTSAVQRGPLWWAAHHRDHHRHSDHEEDVHSPHVHSFYWSHMGWITSKKNHATKTGNVKDLMKFPELRFLNDHDIFVPVLLAVSLFSIGWLLEVYAPGLGTTKWQMLVWGFFVSTVVLFHATCTINSLSHMFGRRRYETTDQSKNNFLLSLLTFGEGWHNNHHRYPGSVRQGFFWWEIDITYYVLRLMSLFGIVRDLKPVPARIKDTGFRQ